MEPLAYSMRPKNFDEIVGQSHLIGKNGAIRRLVKNNKLPSIILYGKPGIGKTTIANVIVSELGLPSSTFNASSDNKASLMKHIENAKISDKYVLIVDEILAVGDLELLLQLVPLLFESDLLLFKSTVLRLEPYDILSAHCGEHGKDDNTSYQREQLSPARSDSVLSASFFDSLSQLFIVPLDFLCIKL